MTRTWTTKDRLMRLQTETKTLLGIGLESTCVTLWQEKIVTFCLYLNILYEAGFKGGE